MKSAYLCVILQIGHKKSILAVFTRNLAKSKMATKMVAMFGDITGLQ